MKFELDFSNYATKADFKNVTVDTSSFAIKDDLANLKCDVEKLDIDNLKNIPTNLNNVENKVDKFDVNELIPVLDDLSKLSDVGKMMLLKKIYIMLRSKNI